MMRFAVVFKTLGLLLMVFSLSMLPPIIISWWLHDGTLFSFFVGMLVTFISGGLLWYFIHVGEYELKTRDGFLVVFLLWTVLSIFGALPLMLDPLTHLSFTDAIFETVSGLTTTGSTVLVHLDKLPASILYYRQQLHFLGGMGIIVLAIAILPMLGIGGLQLYKAETVGPFKTSKLKPRMTQTAKALWMVYIGLIVVCAVCFYLCGMHPLDAIGESFSVLSTGGFSTHDSSFAFYHSDLIDCIAIFFMVLGATNFGLHYKFLVDKQFSAYIKDAEFMAYIKILGLVALICFITLVFVQKDHHASALINSIFTVVSVSTTTGLATENFNIWPTFLPYLLMFMALLGGCGGSTSGGFKIVRLLLMKEQIKRELHRLIHPKSVVLVKLGNEVLPEDVAQSIWAFISVFVIMFIVMLLVLLADGLTMRTAFGALVSSFSNVGASIGAVANGFEHIPSFSKWVCIFAMLLGRLEIFTILVLLTPSYWRN